MYLSEHHAKALLSGYGVPVPEGGMAASPEQAKNLCERISSAKFVVKAQIPAGGRGLAGGVKFAKTPGDVADEARKLLGATLETEQTGSAGELVESVYVEAAVDIAESYFLAVAFDPESGSPMLLASSGGGVEFEQRARMGAGTVKTLTVSSESEPKTSSEPESGPGSPSVRISRISQFLTEVGIDGSEPANVVNSAVEAFLANDIALLEINPFSKTLKGEWMAIDAKITLDGNAAFRRPELAAMASDLKMSDSEMEAQKSNINLVKLDGEIGVVVNGAGLGLATNDIIVDCGLRPANFMDIRTTAQSFDVARGVELLLQDPGVSVILLNIHGGGMTSADTVAEGVSFAYSRSNRKLPIVAHVAGHNAEWGLRILRERKLPVESAESMSGAVAKIVEKLASEGSR